MKEKSDVPATAVIPVPLRDRFILGVEEALPVSVSELIQQIATHNVDDVVDGPVLPPPITAIIFVEVNTADARDPALHYLWLPLEEFSVVVLAYSNFVARRQSVLVEYIYIFCARWSWQTQQVRVWRLPHFTRFLCNSQEWNNSQELAP